MAPLRKPILAANWKMNLGPTAASGFFESFLSRYAARADRTVIVFPSAIALLGHRFGEFSPRFREKPRLRQTPMSTNEHRT